MLMLYGLKNCDTCKKARAWLNVRGIEYTFIDYRASPLTTEQISTLAEKLGWEKLINRTSTTWRALSESDKSTTGSEHWLALLTAYPSLMRRPVLIDGDQMEAGFNEARYQARFIRTENSGATI